MTTCFNRPQNTTKADEKQININGTTMLLSSSKRLLGRSGIKPRRQKTKPRRKRPTPEVSPDQPPSRLLGLPAEL